MRYLKLLLMRIYTLQKNGIFIINAGLSTGVFYSSIWCLPCLYQQITLIFPNIYWSRVVNPDWEHPRIECKQLRCPTLANPGRFSTSIYLQEHPRACNLYPASTGELSIVVTGPDVPDFVSQNCQLWVDFPRDRP